MADKEILIEQVLKLRDAHENGFIRLYGYLLKFELESYSEEELQKILSSTRKLRNQEVIAEASNLVWQNTPACKEMVGIDDCDNVTYKQALLILKNQQAIESRQNELDEIEQRKERLRAKKEVKASALRQKIVDNPYFTDIPFFHFYWFMPIRMGRVSDYYQDIRTLVYDFKYGYADGKVASLISKYLRYHFTDAELNTMYFCCVPAHSMSATESRWKKLSQLVCKSTGLKNGFKFLISQNDRPEKHYGNDVHSEYVLDKNALDGKFIILFDDVVTSGKTMGNYVNELKHSRANIICRIALAKTCGYYDGTGNKHPWDQYKPE